MNIPLSFDLDGSALRPDYVVKCSYGNDSIALIQWLHEYDQKHPLGKVVVLYNNTGWAAKWWEGRVENGEKLARSYGFIPSSTEAPMTWEELVLSHNTWPDVLRRFCTEDLKIVPTMNWLVWNDPEGKAEMVCGVRREESSSRSKWPEYIDSSSTSEGRPQWSPLVHVKKEERDELIRRAGWVPLPHRSRECRCVLANSTDLKTWSEEDIEDVAKLEKKLSLQNQGSKKFMFHPKAKKGAPQGIREVVEWAKRVKTKAPATGGCDSGYCTG